MNKRGVIIAFILIAALSCVPAFASGENLSQGRTLGIGMEGGYPWGGLVSARYWFTPTIGVEGIVFAWGNLPDLTSSFTGRILYRMSDTETVDFYLAAGPTMHFSPYEEADVILSGVGGIEFSFPFAPNLAFNLEFGGAVSTTGTLTMAFGSGIHFYF